MGVSKFCDLPAPPSDSRLLLMDPIRSLTEGNLQTLSSERVWTLVPEQWTQLAE
jgi:hypothetical protein